MTEFKESVEAFLQKKRTPEENLLISIISRAVADYATGTKEDRRTARSFLYAPLVDDPKPWSFQWMCAHINLDPKKLTKDALEMEKIRAEKLGIHTSWVYRKRVLPKRK